MDAENAFVDVCGDGDENRENFSPVKREQRQEPTKFEFATARLTRDPSPEGADASDGSCESAGEEEPAASGRKGTRARDGMPRKEKSLGKVCNKFLLQMGEEARNGGDIHLESVAGRMRVEKRRIYDIVNVMEALEAMSKTNKSFYRWHGLSQLPQLMHALQSEAQKGELPRRIDDVAAKMCAFVELGAERSGLGDEGTDESAVPRREALGAPSLDSSASSACDEGIASRDRCGKNSLAQLCRRFLMVLLCKQSRKVSLDVASTVLIKDYEPPPRSKCRRLYDIANVLVAMRLILKRHYLFGTKKIPLFEYCGPEPEVNAAAAHVGMLDFLQRSGLTAMSAGEAATPGKGDAQREEGKKRKREESAEQIGPKRAKQEPVEGKRPTARVQVRVLGERNGQGEARSPGAEMPLPKPRPMMPTLPPIAMFPMLPQHSSLEPFCQSLSLLTSLFAPVQQPFVPPAPTTARPLQQGSADAKKAHCSPRKVRHSVHSILGVSQRENISATGANSLQASPKAFKPVHDGRINR